jgi:NH3-dependent NAD+ synthetase
VNKISKWIKEYADKNGIKSLVVGVSGVVDSAVVS